MATGKLLQVDRRVLEPYSGSDGGTPAPLVILPGAVPVRTLEPAGATSNGRSSSLGWAARRNTGRFLTTVLMTDIVNSTRTVARMGDRRWRELLADHYEDCRAQIEHAGGELAETTGDGILAIFDGATRAVRAGIAIGSMLAFEPRGRQELRGVPGAWTVFSATDAD